MGKLFGIECSKLKTDCCALDAEHSLWTSKRNEVAVHAYANTCQVHVRGSMVLLDTEYGNLNYEWNV